MTKIFGIVVVKNEDIFIERVVKNIVNFCDEILILDNHSTDGTYDILSSLNDKYENIHLMTLDHIANSGRYIEHLVGENCWVFGVDGDEIYDPIGLEEMRHQLLSGKYSDTFHIKGSFLHCNDIDENNKMVSGWLDARSACKLYNMNHLQQWYMTERLHGARLHKNGETHLNCTGNISLDIEKGGPYSWEDSPLRCVHTCFLRRSSNDPENVSPRKHPLGELNWKERKYVGKNLVKKYAPFI